MEAKEIHALAATAAEVAFDEDGAIHAARSEARGSEDEKPQELSDRDEVLLSIGCIAGAAVAIARAQHPYDHTAEALHKADFVMGRLREEEARASFVSLRADRRTP